MTRNWKNNKTGLSRTILVVVVAIILIVAIAGAYYVSNYGSPPKNPSPSALPTGTSSPISSSSPLPSSSATITGAKTVQFSISLTQGGVTNGSSTYYVKNVDEISNSYKWGRPANFMMRIEHVSSSGAKTITVLDAAQQKAWANSNGQWQDISAEFANQFDPINTQFLGYWTNLKSWSGTGDLTYAANGATIRIFDIQVNPTLSGSLFGPN
jgi:hypothetical protein